MPFRRRVLHGPLFVVVAGNDGVMYGLYFDENVSPPLIDDMQQSLAGVSN